MNSETKEAESPIEFYFVPIEEEREESNDGKSDIRMENNDSSYDVYSQKQEDQSDVDDNNNSETGFSDRTTVFTTDSDMDDLKESDVTSDLFVDEEPI